MNHLNTGRSGEQLGITYFANEGYKILSKNWRYSRWEVDLIAEKNKVLHFIEIKTRRSSKFGYPEESVGSKKIKNLINAAEEYLFLNPQWQRIQFDILAIYVPQDQPPEFFLIEDVS